MLEPNTMWPTWQFLRLPGPSSQEPPKPNHMVEAYAEAIADGVANSFQSVLENQKMIYQQRFVQFIPLND